MNNSRRTSLPMHGVALAALIFAPVHSFAVPAGKAAVNVLFLMADDMRFEIGAYGAPQVITPNLDRLASQGTIFTAAHCQYPQCAPSRSSLFTGMRPDATRVYDVFTHFRKALPDVVTLPELFKKHGYTSQGLGKVYHSNLDDAASWSVPHWEPDLPAIQYVNPATVARIAKKRQDAAKIPGLTPRQRAQAAYGPVYENEDAPESAYHDGQVTDKAIELLRQDARGGKPFFLAVGLRKPHLPFIAPKRYWDMYENIDIKVAANPTAPEGAPVYGPVDGGEFRSYEDLPEWPAPIPDAQARNFKRAYYACITFVDAQIGRILGELDRLGIADNTLVVFVSDHGYHLGEQSHWGKWTPYEWDTRTPLMMRGPGVPPGVVERGLVEFVDIYPTVAALTGFDAPPNLEGSSLMPLLEHPRENWKQAVFSQVLRQLPDGNRMAVSMRTGRFRLTRWSAEGDRNDVRAVELYDHKVDPAEMKNVAKDPAYAAELARLNDQFDRGWRAEIPEIAKP